MSAAVERTRHTPIGNLRAELQKIYVSETNIERPYRREALERFYGVAAEDMVAEMPEAFTLVPMRDPRALPGIEVRRGTAPRDVEGELVWAKDYTTEQPSRKQQH